MGHMLKVREGLLKSVESLTDQQINEAVAENTWTIAQNLEHLYLIEIVVAKGIKYAKSQAPYNVVKEKPIHLTVDRSRKVPAPSHLEPSAHFLTLDELKEKLTESRRKLLQIVMELTEQDRNEKSFEHPVFGMLSIQQWIEFVGFHEERHLLQIEEVKQLIS